MQFFISRLMETDLFYFTLPYNTNICCYFSDAARAGEKYSTTSQNRGYCKYMKLKIRNVGPGDFGSYRCVAKNSLGETDGLIKLDGN